MPRTLTTRRRDTRGAQRIARSPIWDKEMKRICAEVEDAVIQSMTTRVEHNVWSTEIVLTACKKFVKSCSLYVGDSTEMHTSR